MNENGKIMEFNFGQKVGLLKIAVFQAAKRNLFISRNKARKNCLLIALGNDNVFLRPKDDSMPMG